MSNQYSLSDVIKYGFLSVCNNFKLFLLTGFIIFSTGAFFLLIGVTSKIINIDFLKSEILPYSDQDYPDQSIQEEYGIRSIINVVVKFMNKTFFNFYKFFNTKNKLLFLFFTLLFQCFISWQALGLARIGLDLVDTNQSSAKRLVDVLRYLAQIIVADAIYYSILVIGLICFIVPGVFWGLRAYFYRIAILENKSINQSFEYSFSLTEKQDILGWILFTWIMNLPLLNLVGWFTNPVSAVYLYRKLEKKNYI